MKGGIRRGSRGDTISVVTDSTSWKSAGRSSVNGHSQLDWARTQNVFATSHDITLTKTISEYVQHTAEPLLPEL